MLVRINMYVQLFFFIQDFFLDNLQRELKHINEYLQIFKGKNKSEKHLKKNKWNWECPKKMKTG